MITNNILLIKKNNLYIISILILFNYNTYYIINIIILNIEN